MKKVENNKKPTNKKARPSNCNNIKAVSPSLPERERREQNPKHKPRYPIKDVVMMPLAERTPRTPFPRKTPKEENPHSFFFSLDPQKTAPVHHQYENMSKEENCILDTAPCRPDTG